jgi:preprotein translocase subunit SecF
VFQILKNPQFDFMRRGELLLGVSAALVVVAVVVLFVAKLNLGIEFTGGTEVQVKYAEAPRIGDIRRALESAGLKAQVTTIGKPEENEIYIRLAEGGQGGESADLTGLVSRTLRGDAVAEGKLDLNIADQATLRDLLSDAPGLTSSQAEAAAAGISTHRKEVAIYHGVEDLAAAPEVTAEIVEFLRENADTGPLAVRSQSYVGPAVGKELMQKAQLAIVMSLIMMLIYIWIRFQLQWGFAAVLALTHDTAITLGLFSLLGYEMSLPVVAAFLTLVGYSVNDTVVVFDRIRENVKNRAATSFEATINLSINQTLGRTIITSGLTWLVVFTIGVIVGTYSSIYIASPILMVWNRISGQRTAALAGGAPVARRVKKVRTTS